MVDLTDPRILLGSKIKAGDAEVWDVQSYHNIKQIRNKELQKVSKIFLSSIFKVNKNFLGINKFKLTSKLTKKDIVVLGGITKKNIKLIKLVDCKEFAGISFFE